MSASGSQFLGLDMQCAIDGAHILIGYHGGCVDGCAAAFMLSKTIKHCHATAEIKVVPLGHQAMRFSEPGLIEPGMLVFSVDITPTLEDSDALLKAASVILFDHHTSELATQAKLVQTCPNILNRSTSSGLDCASSMIFELVKELYPFNHDVVSMVHKMDVFDHDMPKHLEDDFPGFRAYVTQKGERNVDMHLVENMFIDPRRCVAEGKERAALATANTEALAAGLQVVAEQEGWRILFVTQLADRRPIDNMHYQRKIDERKTGKPTLVITRDVNPLTNGLYNLGLRRAGDNLNISTVAVEFKTKPGVIGGGGHPFAGGVQSNVRFTEEEVVSMAVEVMSTIHRSEQCDK